MNLSRKWHERVGRRRTTGKRREVKGERESDKEKEMGQQAEDSIFFAER